MARQRQAPGRPTIRHKGPLNRVPKSHLRMTTPLSSYIHLHWHIAGIIQWGKAIRLADRSQKFAQTP